MTTPLPSRLRASAQVMRKLPRIDDGWAREVNSPVALRIARELEEAAQALEAGRGEPVAWRVRGHAFDFNTDEPRLWHYYTGSRRPTVGVPYRCDIEPLYAAPAAQVAQEGDAGVATDTPAVCRLCLAVTGGRQCFEPACPGGVATDGGDDAREP